jgi:hypothetical protein
VSTGTLIFSEYWYEIFLCVKNPYLYLTEIYSYDFFYTSKTPAAKGMKWHLNCSSMWVLRAMLLSSHLYLGLQSNLSFRFSQLKFWMHVETHLFLLKMLTHVVKNNLFCHLWETCQNTCWFMIFNTMSEKRVELSEQYIVMNSQVLFHDGSLSHWKFSTQPLITISNSSTILTHVQLLPVL